MEGQITESVTVDASPETVFEFINTPEECVRASPSQEFHDIQTLPNDGHEYDYEFRMVGVSLTGHCESIECDPDDRVLVYDYSGGIEAEMALSVESDGDAGSRLVCETTYEVPDSVLGTLARPVVERFNRREMESFTRNVRDMIESGGVEVAVDE